MFPRLCCDGFDVSFPWQQLWLIGKTQTEPLEVTYIPSTRHESLGLGKQFLVSVRPQGTQTQEMSCRNLKIELSIGHHHPPTTTTTTTYRIFADFGRLLCLAHDDGSRSHSHSFFNAILHFFHRMEFIVIWQLLRRMSCKHLCKE